MKIPKYTSFFMLLMMCPPILCSFNDDCESFSGVSDKHVRFSGSTKTHSTHHVLNSAKALLQRQKAENIDQENMLYGYELQKTEQSQIKKYPDSARISGPCSVRKHIRHYRSHSARSSAALAALANENMIDSDDKLEEFSQPSLNVFLNNWNAAREQRAYQDKGLSESKDSLIIHEK